MNEFNTKLLELLNLIASYTEVFRLDGVKFNKLFKELEEMNEQEIEQVNSTPIYELDLSVRSANLLDKGGIKTIGDLENASFDYISHLRNIGHLSLREIYTKLIEWKEDKKEECIRNEIQNSQR